jgi:cytosine/adenosine deaminase-related metal-dependent hydrolase
MRLIHRLCPDVPARTLWEMATVRAAKAISMVDAGTIRPGVAADLVAFACRKSDPLAEILENERLPIATWAAGEKVSPCL